MTTPPLGCCFSKEQYNDNNKRGVRYDRSFFCGLDLAWCIIVMICFWTIALFASIVYLQQPLLVCLSATNLSFLLVMFLLPQNRLVRNLNYFIQTILLIMLTALLPTFLILMETNHLYETLCTSDSDEQNSFPFNDLNDCTSFMHKYLYLAWMATFTTILATQTTIVLILKEYRNMLQKEDIFLTTTTTM